MDVGTVLVFLFIFLLTYFLFGKRRNLPPGPFNYPLIGCMRILKMIKKQRPHHALMDLAKEYGPVFSFRLGKQPIVVLNGFDALNEAFVKQSDDFSDRPNHLPLFKLVTENGHGIVFNNYNHNWKVLRRFTLQALRDFGVGKSSLEEKILTEVDALTRAFIQHEGSLIDINAYMTMSVGNIIFGIVFGTRHDYDDPKFANVRMLTNGSFEGDGALNIINYLPASLIKFTMVLSKYVSVKDREVYFLRLVDFVNKKIAEHEATYDENMVRDFVDLHIKTMREGSRADKKELTKNEMTRTIVDLFVAGTETTSSSLDWAFLYMAEFPEVQKRCQAEIEEMLGDKTIQYSDRDKLPYLNATLLEIQRASVISPVAAVHCTLRDTKLYGYDIPANTVILPNVYSALYDPKYWTEPEQFRPERFLDSSGKLIKAEAFIPFSTGPRQCLGEPLAKMELFLFFANLLQRFSFQRANDEIKHSFRSKSFQTNNVPEPYRLRVKNRKTF